MQARRPEEIIRLAVKGMMPRNRLARKQLTKLKIYAGPEHPHVAQNPQLLDAQAAGSRLMTSERGAGSSTEETE
jgi:large subunit ribosomal protein L13